jgi:hypothetical protein
MTNIHRSSKGPSIGGMLYWIESLERFGRHHGQGRYHVDEHSLDPFPGTEVSASAWGKVIHHKDGQVVLDPIPWQ